MDRRREAGPFRSLESLECRTLLSVVSVLNYGATPNDGGDDTPSIQRAINASNPGDTILFPDGTYDLTSALNALPGDRTYQGQGNATLRGRTAAGQMLNVQTDNVTFTGLTLDGGGVFLEKGGGFNQNIVFDNNVFKLNTWGEHNSAITFTAGLGNSKITNNLFTGYTGGFGVYGYNYNDLTIANNEFVNTQAGIHIQGFYNSGNLLAEQNYFTGMKGMGMEFQGRASNLLFQDNWYEHPNLSSNPKSNSNSMAFSLILDQSSNIEIRRNAVIAPERADGIGTRIGFEVGGDNSVVEDNYVNGVNHVLAMNDGLGSASVIARGNKFMNYLQGVSASFPSAIRTLQSINNGPNIALTWDINRGLPGRNHRLGESAPPATPPPADPTPADPAPVDTTPGPTADPVIDPTTPTDVTPTDPTPADPTTDPVIDPTSPTDVTPTDPTPTDPTTDPTVTPPQETAPDSPPDSGPVTIPASDPVDVPPPRTRVAELKPPLETPGYLYARVMGSSRVDVVWQDNSFQEAGYRIERSFDGQNWGEIGVVGPSGTVYSDFGLRPGQTVYYRVRAYTGTELSAYSNVAMATTAGPNTNVRLGIVSPPGNQLIYPFRTPFAPGIRPGLPVAGFSNVSI